MDIAALILACLAVGFSIYNFIELQVQKRVAALTPRIQHPAAAFQNPAAPTETELARALLGQTPKNEIEAKETLDEINDLFANPEKPYMGIGDDFNL